MSEQPPIELLTRVEIVRALRGAIRLDDDGDSEAAMNIIALLHDRLLIEVHWIERDMVAHEVGPNFVNQ